MLTLSIDASVARIVIGGLCTYKQDNYLLFFCFVLWSRLKSRSNWNMTRNLTKYISMTSVGNTKVAFAINLGLSDLTWICKLEYICICIILKFLLITTWRRRSRNLPVYFSSRIIPSATKWKIYRHDLPI